MKIKDVLTKVATGEELTDEEKSFLESYEEPNVDAAANARGKKERVKLQKQIDDLKALIDEKNAEIEEANSGASDLEKLQKQIEKLTLKSEAAEKTLADERAAHANTVRSNKLKSLNVPWMESVPNSYRDTVIGDAFADLDTDDLDDPAIVKPILDSLIESQKNFIVADTKSGAGTGATKTDDTSIKSNEITADNVLSLDQETLVNNLDAAWKAASEGAE